MTIHTLGVGLSVTPTIIGRSIDHYANRKKRKQKPTAHISYDVALGLIRQFLTYASKHTVEDVQAFTAQWVPTPTWVHTEQIKIPAEAIDKAADALVTELGPQGVQQIGGKSWWRWRREGAAELKAEWIEMKADRKRRQKTGEPSKRVMLYVHGGAYFFGSVDEHRYQLQRHARKLKARVLAPRYRLAPQFPFPCGLLDCLATYLHLLTTQDPTTIVLAGDSAGGGMVTSLLVILRDQGLPLPAGAILISPWVDLTHSFPSVAADNEFDYIPPYGFMQKPSMSWPPPNSDDMKSLKDARPGKSASKEEKKEESKKETDAEAAQGVVVKVQPGASPTASTTSLPMADLSLTIDGKTVQLRDQIQMYATNEQLSHPLVSPVLQPSLGGLPPLLILVGGGEMLRDEQIYLAHKAANPTKYPPGEAYLERTPGARELIGKYKPTRVQLQVWDDLCHVAPTLSFTRPAKYMYRSVAQFGAWALAQAQKTDIDIVDDDDVSVITAYSSSSSDEEDEERRARREKKKAEETTVPTDKIGKAGDEIPHFRNNMVRQRVDRNGNVYRLPAEQHLPALQVASSLVGVVKPGPVRKWMEAKSRWDSKYASQKRKVQKRRLREIQKGYLRFEADGVVEMPPPSALAGRRGLSDTSAPKSKKSLGLMFWSMVGSKHDEDALDREEKLDREVEAKVTVTNADGTTTTTNTTEGGATKDGGASRSRSHHRTVSYQANVDENTTAAELEAKKQEQGIAVGAIAGAAAGTAAAAAVVAGKSSKDGSAGGDAGPTEDSGLLSPTFVPLSKLQKGDAAVPAVLPVDAKKDPLVLEGTNVTLASPEATRPKADGVAFPFKLNKSIADHQRNASMVTLNSNINVRPDTPGSPSTPKNEETRSLAPSGLSRDISSTGAPPPAAAAAAAATPAPVTSATPVPVPAAAEPAAVEPVAAEPTAAVPAAAETDLDATPKPKKVSAPLQAAGAAGAAVAAGGAAAAATLAATTTTTTTRTHTSSTVETVSTLDQTSEPVTTPPVVAPSTIFSSGPTLFPADDGTGEEPSALSATSATPAMSEVSASASTIGPVRTETPSMEKQLNGITTGPVRTETPNLEQQIKSLGLEGSGGGTRRGPGDVTPKGGAESSGWATPRAGSISTAPPSEAGDTLSRFETAEE